MYYWDDNRAPYKPDGNWESERKRYGSHIIRALHNH